MKFSAGSRELEDVGMGGGLDGEAVAEGDEFAGVGGDAFAGNDDADKIERIGGRDGDDFARGLLMARGPQGFNSDGQCELLTKKIGDKAATANFPAILEAAKRNQQLAPLGKNRFASEKFTEDDAIAAQEHPADGF